MWTKVAQLIIRYRLPLMILIAIITAIMGFYASRVEMSYDPNRTVPMDDPDMVVLTKFRKQFGEDGNIIAVGMKDSSIYSLKNFNAFRELTQTVRKLEGVNEVISIPALRMILKDTANAKFSNLPRLNLLAAAPGQLA
jgi:predicted RND superfamily exporter protein